MASSILLADHSLTQLSRYRRLARWLFAACISLLCLGISPSSQAASAVCDFATGRGATGPVDFARYCWIDFGNYNDTQARSATGQDFSVSLPSGTLSFNLKVSGGGLTTAPVPVWGGAPFGASAFISIPGTPTLYQTTAGTTTNVTLSNIVVSTSGGDQPYTFVAADAESSNNGESLSFAQTGGNNWYQLAQMQNGTSTLYPTVSGLGTTTVTETGVVGTVGAYAFASDFPVSKTIGSVTAVIDGGGLQGAAFGIKYHSADMTISSTHTPATFVPGGAGSYTLTVHNNGPEKNVWATGDTTTVTTTLPADLTYLTTGSGGTNWSCAAAGQTVTCTSTATANPGTDMADITLNVSVANTPASLPASITTTSSVTNSYDYDSSNNSVSDVTPILHSSLATSTKSVVDVNGGDLNPGDILKYTLMLTESNGLAATGVSVSDDMPAQIGSLNVISTPTGSTDSSTTTGGANGTGQVNISNISVPANGSVTIVYQVTAGAVSNGQTITNTATITNPDPNGAGASPSASIVVVQVPPSSGNKVLYVYTSNDSLTRTPQTGTGGDIRLDRGDTHDFTLTPALAKKLTLVAGSSVNVTLLVQCTRNNGGNNCRNADRSAWSATLYDDSPTPANIIGSTSPDASFQHNNYTPESVSIPVSATTNIASGHRLILRISNNATNNNNRYLHIEQYDNGDRSYLTLNTSTVINVDSVAAYSAPYPSTSQPSSFTPGSNVYVRAVISDPFGDYDIDPTTGGVAPTITIKDSNSTTQLAATNLSAVTQSPDDPATKTFEYQYTLPSTAASGYWTPSVTATEGNASIDATYNGGTNITHSRNGAFDVEAPNLMLMKSVSVFSDPTGSSTPHALPGAIMQYSINVTNQGQGAVDANTTKLSDTLNSDTTYIVGSASFVDGSPASGLSFNATTNVEYCTGAGGSSCPYSSGVSAGSPDPAITKVIFTPQGVLNGKASNTAPAPSFTIHYQVQLQ